MIRRSKTIVLPMVAMLALGALVAQAASASPLTVTNGASGTTFYTGDQDGGIHVFTSSAEVKCKGAVFTAKSTGASVNDLTVTPTYTDCSAFGFATAHVNVNGCTFTFTTPSDSGFNQVTWSGSQLHIICGAKEIEITPMVFGMPVCTQFIGAQTANSGNVIGTSTGGTGESMDITLDINLTGISYTGTGGACGTSGNSASYVGNSTVRAYSNSGHTNQRGITFS